MNLFLAENQPLTLGIVMNHIGRNPALMGKILEGQDKGLFELALHGYDHLYYTKLPPQEQLNQLSYANLRMQDLFGKPSEVFIPPYDVFNNYTIDAMTKLGIKIISAGDYAYNIKFRTSQYPIFFPYDVGKVNSGKDNINQVVHIPRDTGFEAFEGGQAGKIPPGQILNDTNQHVLKFGYSVIVMHPTSFLIRQNGTYTTTVDEKEINNLKNLIESIKSKNIHITSFSKLAAVNHYATAQQCDQSLWRHIFQPHRLTVIDICKTVSGTIVSHRIQASHETSEGDGDIHIRIKLDPQFTSILKPANYAEQNGYLVVEPICQTPPTAPVAIPFCKNFHQNINIPPDGTHVTLTGSYVLDEEHHRWAEIHPVTSIVPSPAKNFTLP
jgi:peptidoglycan/xylan/chitin deacetylase (PgdA/CDA1 family)